MKFQTMTAMPHVLATWYKIEKPGKILKVYIEGDGNAFNLEGIPTDNPTPKSEFMRELAAGDPSPNVVYLARPCQYVQMNCTEEDWTSGRFSLKIINSMDQTLLALMKKSHSSKVVLIGFSGGAQVAGLLAVRHPEKIEKLITISGVLDHEAWTSYHGDSCLNNSLNLKNYKTIFRKLPQIHYAGGKDEIVPKELIQEFVGNQNVIVIEKAGHGTNFESIYESIYGVQ